MKIVLISQLLWLVWFWKCKPCRWMRACKKEICEVGVMHTLAQAVMWLLLEWAPSLGEFNLSAAGSWVRYADRCCSFFLCVLAGALLSWPVVLFVVPGFVVCSSATVFLSHSLAPTSSLGYRPEWTSPALGDYKKLQSRHAYLFRKHLCFVMWRDPVSSTLPQVMLGSAGLGFVA